MGEVTGRASITCPICRMTSYHPVDVELGYCGHCHAFTGEGPSVLDPRPSQASNEAAQP